MPRITSSHHVLCVEHLLGELWNTEGSILLRSSGSEGGKPGHKEVKTREGNHVDRQLSQISVQLTGEPEHEYRLENF